VGLSSLALSPPQIELHPSNRVFPSQPAIVVLVNGTGDGDENLSAVEMHGRGGSQNVG
jgi:hypothetical protein